MVDINDDTKPVRRRAEVTGIVRRRRWTDDEKGRIVAEAVAPEAPIVPPSGLLHPVARTIGG